MNKIKLYLAFIALTALFACENDPFYFNSEARLRMEGPEVWTLGTDSLEFSFANYSSTVTDTTFDITVYVMGEAADQARTAEFEIDPSLSTAETNMYSFPEMVTIPTGELSVNLPVTVKRTESLQTTQVQLYIKIKENADFKIGVTEQNHLLLKWSDILSKPNNWDDLEEFFGVYSLTKYRFIIDVLNTGEFDTDTLSWAQMKNYQIELAEALRLYNEANPGNPLADENGNLITF
ncbi:DUF4843 domain-containing protein [uncultured Draconibacterium sp.]|uniref:DUF4843 domain-containing protein n=1 Tax=uncultured Draconibacterium sp. TaxID=1573823 RepID=UPI0029C89673|nr:DUF4843 domain-containing protein [uncultured Draconibacterium sp.]